MKKFLSIILFIAMLLTAVSCTKADGSANNEQDSASATTTEILDGTKEPETKEPETKETIEDNSPKRYEIDLTLANYKTYLTYTPKTGTNQRGQIASNYVHAVSGVLTYAYYENVVVTFELQYEIESRNETKLVTYYLYLNAAGNAEFNCDDAIVDYTMRQYHAKVTLVNISGKVIFSI